MLDARFGQTREGFICRPRPGGRKGSKARKRIEDFTWNLRARGFHLGEVERHLTELEADFGGAVVSRPSRRQQARVYKPPTTTAAPTIIIHPEYFFSHILLPLSFYCDRLGDKKRIRIHFRLSFSGSDCDFSFSFYF